MNIILGGTGRVGSAVAQALLDQAQPVLIVTHDPTKAPAWTAKGAQTAVVDVLDVAALRRVFRQGRRAFLLNPPADPTMDTVAAERTTATAIAEALQGSGLEKLVVQSTYGAQPGEGAGDLNVLYHLEQGAIASSIPTSVIRAAYYMSNWDASIEPARAEGIIHTLFPADFKLPMVAPTDLGQVAARLLTEPADRTGVVYVEGPRPYSAADVAAGFTAALGTPVKAVATPRSGWQAALQALGFSAQAAQSYTTMTAVTLDQGAEKPTDPERGATTLEAYISDLVS